VKLNVISFCTLVVVSLLSLEIMAAGPLIVPSHMSSSSNVGNHHFKSFREWKTVMVSSAESKFKNSARAVAIKRRNSASMNDPNLIGTQGIESGLNLNLQELQKQAENDQYQLSIAKDLTISDYFVGYLTKQKDLSAAINEVSGRLTAEEVAELMAAYANNFFTSRPTSLGAPSRAGSNQ